MQYGYHHDAAPCLLQSFLIDSDHLLTRIQHRFERLSEPFDLLGKATIPVGSYHFDEAILEIITSFNRPLRGELEVLYGTFFSGERLRVRGKVEWRPSYHWLFAFEYDHNEFWLGPVEPQGTRVRSRVARLRVNVQFTPNVSWVTFAQYDNVNDTVGINSRFRWIVSDGREFFIVLNQAVLAEGSDLRAGATEPLVQAIWTFRF